ncbi:MAG: hypothetical protein OSJ66_00520 [Clostridia bacterium]|nr:hypothetical protein [Clostridia bacterium]
MKTEGIFTFRGAEAKDGGEFEIDGKLIKYKPSTVVKFDEEVNGKVFERTVKVSNDNVELLTKLNQIKLYSPVMVSFDINFYGSKIVLSLLDIVQLEEDEV